MQDTENKFSFLALKILDLPVDKTTSSLEHLANAKVSRRVGYWIKIIAKVTFSKKVSCIYLFQSSLF